MFNSSKSESYHHKIYLVTFVEKELHKHHKIEQSHQKFFEKVKRDLCDPGIQIVFVNGILN